MKWKLFSYVLRYAVYLSLYFGSFVFILPHLVVFVIGGVLGYEHAQYMDWFTAIQWNMEWAFTHEDMVYFLSFSIMLMILAYIGMCFNSPYRVEKIIAKENLTNRN